MSGGDHPAKRARVHEDLDAAIGQYGMPAADDLPDWLKDVAHEQLLPATSLPANKPMANAPTGQDLFPFQAVSDDNFKILEVPANLKSGLIGKGGHMINYIRKQTQSDIQIQNPTAGSNFATIMIRGNVEVAEKMIQEQIEGLQKHGDSESWNNELVDVPQYLVALVCGPQGKKLHELMEKSACQMKFIRESDVRPGAQAGKQICSVRGPSANLAHGVQLVREQIELARAYDAKKNQKKLEASQQRLQTEGCGVAGWRATSSVVTPFPQQWKPLPASSGSMMSPGQMSGSGMGGMGGSMMPTSNSSSGQSGPFPQQWR